MDRKLEVPLTGSILTYYVLAGIIAICRRRPQNQTQRNPRVRKFLIALAASLITTSIAAFISRSFLVGSIGKDGDPGLTSDAIFILTTTILLFGQIDSIGLPRYPHAGAWVLSVLARLFGITKGLAKQNISTTSAILTKVFLSGQIGLLLCLILVNLGAWCLQRRHTELADDEETQPLLSNDVQDKDKVQKEADDDKEPDKDEEARKEIRNRPFRQYISSFHVFLPFMRPSTKTQSAMFVGVCICTACTRVINIVRPLALGWLVNDFAEGNIPWKGIPFYLFIYFIGSGVGISLASSYLSYRMSSVQRLALNRAAYAHIMDLSADFHDFKKSSSVWRSIWQARAVITLLYDVIFDILPTIVDFFAALIVLGSLFGPYMLLLVSNTAALFLWLNAKTAKPRADLVRVWNDADDAALNQMADSTQHWHTVSQFDQIIHEKNQYHDKGGKTQERAFALYHFFIATSAMLNAVLMVPYILACCLAAAEIAQGQKKLGAFVILTAYWEQLTGPLHRIMNQIKNTTEKLVDAERLLVLMEKVPTIRDAPNSKEFDYMGGAVDFENVCFSYDGKRKASEGITFRAPAGSKTALVGMTGAGKSSILKLLLRFYDPEKGRILVDGQDVKSVTLRSLRSHIATVDQNPSMFHTTVLDNVRYPDFSSSEEEVQEACKAASLHDKIMTFAKGYNTKVGERGCRLSGGELQRLAIARAILKKPDILLLDEATSNVDSVTEAQIQASFDSLCKGRTTFVIAHRLSTILQADQILVIDEGKLVESGTHSELLKKKGAYHKLWSSQLKLQGEQERKARGRSNSPDKQADLAVMNDLRENDEDAIRLVNETKGEGDEDKDASDGEGKAQNGHAQQGLRKEGNESKRRARSTGREMVSALRRRISSISPVDTLRKRRPEPKDVDPAKNGDLLPNHSSLKADAPVFVPQSMRDNQKDGTSGVFEDADALVDDDGDHMAQHAELRKTMSEADAAKLAAEKEESELSSDAEDQGHGRHSRIPKRIRVSNEKH